MSAALHKQSKRASRVILMLSISILDAACRCQSVLFPASVAFSRSPPLSLVSSSFDSCTPAHSVTTASYPLSCLTPLLLLALPSYLISQTTRPLMLTFFQNHHPMSFFIFCPAETQWLSSVLSFSPLPRISGINSIPPTTQPLAFPSH